MSAKGQKRTWRDQIAMSALPPIADIRPRDRQTKRNLCFPYTELFTGHRVISLGHRCPLYACSEVGSLCSTQH
jgi:hypothetical protein